MNDLPATSGRALAGPDAADAAGKHYGRQLIFL